MLTDLVNQSNNIYGHMLHLQAAGNAEWANLSRDLDQTNDAIYVATLDLYNQLGASEAANLLAGLDLNDQDLDGLLLLIVEFVTIDTDPIQAFSEKLASELKIREAESKLYASGVTSQMIADHLYTDLIKRIEDIEWNENVAKLEAARA